MVFLPFPLFAEASADALLQQQRLTFEQAEQALKKNQHSVFETYRKSLENYPLYPYLVYQDLKQKISQNPQKVTLKQLEQFSNRYPDFPHQGILRKTWLHQMAHGKHWREFVSGYPAECKDVALTCQYLYGQYHLTHESTFLDKAKPLWLSGKNQPPECDPLFKAMQAAGKITPDMIWERIGLAFKANNPKIITHLGKTLSHADRKSITLWEKGLKNPTLITQKSWRDGLTTKPKVKAEIASQVLLRLAKQDPETAHHWFETHEADFRFSAAQTLAIEQGIAMYLAHQRSPLAIPWMEQISPEALDRPLQEWRVRLSLLSENYADVLHEIHKLPAGLQQEDLWQYWKARALDKTGRYQEAQAIYELLAKHRTYYGLLSSQRLQQPFQLNHRPAVVSQHTLAAVAAKPGIQRFHEFMAIQRPANARVEWFRAVDNMSPEERLAAAKIADQLGLADIAILTSLKTDHKDDIHLRFPLSHRQDVQRHAKKHGLDPAWIYALIRQESAFHDEAVSAVGARGLMQIMPETGQTLAKDEGIRYTDDAILFKPTTNIHLGTKYIKQLKNRMQESAIITTAAYNAGPTKVRKWLPEKPMDPEIWIETIPYRETRDYVKNVLTFTAIYQQRLNNAQKMPLFTGPIPPK